MTDPQREVCVMQLHLQYARYVFHGDGIIAEAEVMIIRLRVLIKDSSVIIRFSSPSTKRLQKFEPSIESEAEDYQDG